MNISARIFGFGVFFLWSAFFAHQIYAQEQNGTPPSIPTDISVDESDNPYLQEPSPSPEPTHLPTPSVGIAVAPAGQVLGSGTGPESTIGQASWVIDPVVTQVGRNAERARQFIYWVVTHSPVYNVPQIYQAYFFVQRLTWVLAIFVIIGLAIQLVLTRKSIGPTFSGISIGFDQVTIATIVIRMVLILSFIFFSYNIMLGFIQASDAMSNFFISRLGGEDLFNIVFSGSNDTTNYEFVGYKNADPLEQDMVFTSLFLVRMTSFTYNFMAIILILRQVILIFLLILSPILALLLPFIFIRNIGSVWIGEFFRWLFYGPLFSLFIAALARIWKGGIPYEFDFGPAERGEMVYRTGINILYGGPAQILSPTNTGNYVDTYAEYIIALVMLWAAIMLPWLLLKIFRDYCCDILEKNQGVLMQILDKMRGFTPPKPSGPQPTKPGPTGTFGKHMKLPESRPISTREIMTKEKVIEKIRDREIHNVETRDITRAYDLRVSSLRDVARIETQKDKQTQLKETLSNIQNPLRAKTPQTRSQYEALRNEFTARASKGDKLARQIIQAATPLASHIPETIANATPEQLKEAVLAPGKPVTVAQMRVPSMRTVSAETIQKVSEKTHVEQRTVEEILKAVPLTQTAEKEKVKTISARVHISEDQVQKVLQEAQNEIKNQTPEQKISADTIRDVAEKTQSSQDSVEQVLEQVPAVSSMETKEAQAGAISQSTGIPQDQVKRILDATPSDQVPSGPTPTPSVSIEEYEEIRTMWMNHYRKSEIPKSENIKSRQDWIKEDIAQLTNTINLLISPSVKDRQQGMQKVSDLLPFLLLGGFADIETLTYVKAKLEAAKLAYEEMAQVAEAREQAKKDLEDMVVIPATEPKVEQKTMQTEQKLEMPIPNKTEETEEKKETIELPGFHEEPANAPLPDDLDEKLPFRKITIPTNDDKK